VKHLGPATAAVFWNAIAGSHGQIRPHASFDRGTLRLPDS